MTYVNGPYPATPPIRRASTQAPPAFLHPTIAAKLNQYKLGLLAELSHESETFVRFARLAISEAEGLAWSTPFAHLFLPALAEEKIHYTRQWVRRQRRIGRGLGALLPRPDLELERTEDRMG